MLRADWIFAKQHPAEPGTLAEQLAAVKLSLHLAQRRGTRAADQWEDARRLAIRHVREAHLIDNLPADDSPKGES